MDECHEDVSWRTRTVHPLWTQRLVPDMSSTSLLLPSFFLTPFIRIYISQTYQLHLHGPENHFMFLDSDKRCIPAGEPTEKRSVPCDPRTYPPQQ